MDSRRPFHQIDGAVDSEDSEREVGASFDAQTVIAGWVAAVEKFQASALKHEKSGQVSDAASGDDTASFVASYLGGMASYADDDIRSLLVEIIILQAQDANTNQVLDDLLIDEDGNGRALEESIKKQLEEFRGQLSAKMCIYPFIAAHLAQVLALRRCKISFAWFQLASAIQEEEKTLELLISKKDTQENGGDRQAKKERLEKSIKDKFEALKGLDGSIHDKTELLKKLEKVKVTVSDEMEGISKEIESDTKNNDITEADLESKLRRCKQAFSDKNAKDVLDTITTLLCSQQTNLLQLQKLIVEFIAFISSKTTEGQLAKIDQDIDAQQQNDTEQAKKEAREYGGNTDQQPVYYSDKHYNDLKEEKKKMTTGIADGELANRIANSNEFVMLTNYCSKVLVNKATEEQAFKSACVKLSNTTQSTKDKNLKLAGQQVLKIARAAYANNEVKPADLPTLTRFVEGTAKVVRNPTGDLTEHITNTQQAMSLNKQQRFWGKLAGAMMVVLGVILIAGAAVAISTGFGAALGVPAGMLGLKIIATGLVAGVGAGLAIHGFMSFDKASKEKGALVQAGEAVKNIAERQANPAPKKPGNS